MAIRVRQVAIANLQTALNIAEDRGWLLLALAPAGAGQFVVVLAPYAKTEPETEPEA